MSRMKKLLFFVILPLSFILPCVALSDWGMVRIQHYAIENQKEDWARDLLWKSAQAYGMTFREIEASQSFHRYVHLYSSQQCTYESCATAAEIEAERMRAAGQGGIAGTFAPAGGAVPVSGAFPGPGQAEDPRVAEAYYYTALYEGEAGHRDAALPMLRRWLELYPNHSLKRTVEELIVRYEHYRM